MPGDVARALAWLRGHLHEPVRLDQLAAVAGTTPRTLETHFRQCLGATPLGWARHMRLVRARRALESAPARGNVTRVATDCGFAQLGRFAVAYRRAFGESPSQTLRRARAGTARDVDDEALRLTWAAVPACFAVDPHHCEQALADLAQAQARAPAYGLPKALAAWCWSQRAAQHFGSAPADDMARAIRLADAATALAPSDPLALTVASGAYALARRIDDAERMVERALALDPLSPFAWLRRGWLSVYAGEADAAIRELQAALRGLPVEPVRHLALIGIGFAHFVAGRNDRARAWVQSGVAAAPACFWAERVVAAAATLAGSRADGRRVVRRLHRRDPSLTVAIAEAAWPFPRAAAARLAEGLAEAGLTRG